MIGILGGELTIKWFKKFKTKDNAAGGEEVESAKWGLEEDRGGMMSFFKGERSRTKKTCLESRRLLDSGRGKREGEAPERVKGRSMCGW